MTSEFSYSLMLVKSSKSLKYYGKLPDITAAATGSIESDQNGYFTNFGKKNLVDTKVDHLDEVISYLMSAGMSNRQIAERLGKPLSTIQRRTRRLIRKGVVEQKMEIHYDKLGFRKVFFHIYVNKARRDSLALALSKIEGTVSVSICLGTSCDIVVFFIAKDSKEVLDFVQRIQSLENVEKVEWSEELYRSEKMQKLEFIKAKE